MPCNLMKYLTVSSSLSLLKIVRNWTIIAARCHAFHKRGLRRNFCPSVQTVRLGVRSCIVSKLANMQCILKRFFALGSHTILFLSHLPYGNIPTGNRLTGATNSRCTEKNRDFRPISRFISEMIKDRATPTTERQ